MDAYFSFHNSQRKVYVSWALPLRRIRRGIGMQACQIPACLYAGYQKDIKSLLYEGRWGGLAGGFCLGCLKQRFCLDMR